MNKMTDDIEEILYSEEQIQQRIKELAGQVSKDYRGKELCIITILRGAAMFLADLTRMLEDINFTIDFIVLSRGKGEPGEVKIIKDLDHPIYHRHVLIVEDMIDIGESLNYFIEVLKLREPASVRICTLFEKPYNRILPVKQSDYTGFVLPDRFVVGYGLDYRQKYRNLPFVGSLKQNLSPY